MIRTEAISQITFDSSGNPLYLSSEDLTEALNSHNSDTLAHPNKADLDPITGRIKAEQLPEMSFDPLGAAATVQGNVNSHLSDKNNPHGVTAAQVGAAAAGHTHTAADVGAAAASHTHTAAEVGALATAGGAVTGKATFTGGLAVTSAEQNNNMAFFLGVKAFQEGGDVQWIGSSAVPGAIGAVPTARKVNGKPLTGDITLSAADVGALSASGTAVAAAKLATARTIRTNLGSAAAASFDGSANIMPGVTGILPVANGGTGKSTAPVVQWTKLLERTIRFASGARVFNSEHTYALDTSAYDLVYIRLNGTLYLGGYNGDIGNYPGIYVGHTAGSPTSGAFLVFHP